MKTINVLFLVLFYSAQAVACSSDYSCGYGQQCVKPEGTYSLTGTCITPTDKYGLRDYSQDKNWGKKYGPKEIEGCSFTSDCAFGFKCLRESWHIKGLCIK